MSNLQKEFTTFHNTIKLGTYDENKTLRDKRDLLINELSLALKDEKIPGTEIALTFTKIDLGSYAMKTGVVPDGGDYDIDVGVIFNVTRDQYDSHALKKLVFDKLNKQHNRTVEYNRPCITVKYAAGYHVDVAVYCTEGKERYIAWGKQHNKSTHSWWEADPEGLKTWVNDVDSDTERRTQFRRIARYLKKWKGKHFSDSGNIAPPSIGLTIQARNSFIYDQGSDLNALIGVIKGIKSKFLQMWDSESQSFKWSIEQDLPVKPYKNVYYKMTIGQQDVFYKRVDSLLQALEQAINEDSDVETSKILRKVFGKDFPLVEDVSASSVAPYVSTGNNA